MIRDVSILEIPIGPMGPMCPMGPIGTCISYLVYVLCLRLYCDSDR